MTTNPKDPKVLGTISEDLEVLGTSTTLPAEDQDQSQGTQVDRGNLLTHVVIVPIVFDISIASADVESI